jgi:hypothetical protein
MPMNGHCLNEVFLSSSFLSFDIFNILCIPDAGAKVNQDLIMDDVIRSGNTQHYTKKIKVVTDQSDNIITLSKSRQMGRWLVK